MKKLILFLLIACLVRTGFGQYVPQFSQLVKTLEFVNPGYNASKDYPSVVLLYRNQWTGFEGAPEMYALNAHLPFNQKHLGADVNFYNESLGLVSHSIANLGANVDVKLSSSSFLGFGLVGGVELYKIDWTNAIYANMSSSANTEDYDRDNLYLGTGVNLFAPRLHLGASVCYTQLNGDYYSNNERFVYYVNGSFLFSLGQSWALKPAAILRHYAGEQDFDYGAFVLYKDWVWVGIANRFQKAVIFMADVKITDLFRLGYSFDYGYSVSGNTYYSNCHEFRLEFNMPHKKQPFERCIAD